VTVKVDYIGYFAVEIIWFGVEKGIKEDWKIGSQSAKLGVSTSGVIL
jgi:hypothetical protein